jgi:glycosyltransferase involved in cell wall biosynthesis
MVVSWPEAAPEIAARQRTGPPRVGFLGQARSEKGFYLLAEALELLKEPHQVELHASPAPGEPVERWQAAMDRLQARGATLYRGPLSAADYWALLERLDVVALPYDPVRHAHRTSNILTEAIGAGALPVVPAEGWLGGVGGQNGAETFTPWNAAALAEAIDRALRRAATAPATSSAGSQQAWRHLHSAAGFVDAALAAREAALARSAGRLSRP